MSTRLLGMVLAAIVCVGSSAKTEACFLFPFLDPAFWGCGCAGYGYQPYGCGYGGYGYSGYGYGGYAPSYGYSGYGNAGCTDCGAYVQPSVAVAPQPQWIAQTVNVPQTSYRPVTVDQGSYQMVWVPRRVTQMVPQTTYQTQTVLQPSYGGTATAWGTTPFLPPQQMAVQQYAAPPTIAGSYGYPGYGYPTGIAAQPPVPAYANTTITPGDITGSDHPLTPTPDPSYNGPYQAPGVPIGSIPGSTLPYPR